MRPPSPYAPRSHVTSELLPGGSQTLVYFNSTGFAYRIFNDTPAVYRLPIDAAVVRQPALSLSRHLIEAQVRVIALGAPADVRRLSLLGVSEECWNCALTPLTSNLAQPFVQWIDTRWAVDLTVNRSQRMRHSSLVIRSARAWSAC